MAEDIQQKEKFDIGMSDADLLTQISLWEKESAELDTTLRAVRERNLNYYLGKQTGVENIYGKSSKAVENRVFMAVETMIPIASSRLPGVVVKPGQDDEQSQIDARDHEDVLAYQFDRTKIQSLAERFLRDLIIKRLGVFKVYWDRRVDDVGLKVVDPRRIRIPKFGKTVDDLAFVIEELEISYDQAVVEFGKDKADDLVKSSATILDRLFKKVRKKTFLVLEVWTNDFVAWKSGASILKREKNPFFDKDKNNFFTKPKKPYVIKSLFQTEESIIGDTDYISQMIPIQDNINTRKRQIENIAGKVANPPLLIDSDVMSEEQVAMISNEEGVIIYGKDAAAGTKIRFESPGQVPQYLFQDLEFSRQEFDNIWGIHSTTRGERQGRETLGGRQLLKEADLGRIDGVARQLERALDEIAEYWTQLIKLFYTEEKSFSILGEDGIRFVKSFTGARVGDVKPMIKPGSTLREDDFSIKQLGLLLWQNKALGVRTLYKYLKIPNMQEAIDDFIETQSGAIFQQQGEAFIPPEVGAAAPQPAPEQLI